MKLNEIILLAYSGTPISYKIENKEIDKIKIDILNGDEVATIYFKDRTNQFIENDPFKRKFSDFQGKYYIENEKDYRTFLKRANQYDCEFLKEDILSITTNALVNRVDYEIKKQNKRG